MMKDVYNDKEVLKKEKEDKQKIIRDLANKISVDMGFNSTDDRVRLGEDLSGGPVLMVAGKVDLNNLPDGWKYESKCLIFSDYPQEGLMRMKDGKYEFIPIVHAMDKSRVQEYSSPDDVVNAILSVNPQISKDQVYYDRDTGNINIVRTTGNITMPAGLEMQEGCVVDINDPYRKKYPVIKSLASDMTQDNMSVGSGDFNKSDVKKNVDRVAYQKEIQSQYKTRTSEGATVEQFGKSILDFSKMKYANEHYMKNGAGEVATRNKDDNYKSFDTASNSDPRIEATLELNEIWTRAYSKVAGISGKEGVAGDRAFEGDTTGAMFQEAIENVSSCPSRNLSDILKFLCEKDSDLLNHTGFLKVMGVFLADPQIASILGIENINNATAENIASGFDKEANKYLTNEAKETSEAVMEMVKEFKPNPNMYN